MLPTGLSNKEGSRSTPQQEGHQEPSPHPGSSARHAAEHAQGGLAAGAGGGAGRAAPHRWACTAADLVQALS